MFSGATRRVATADPSVMSHRTKKASSKHLKNMTNHGLPEPAEGEEVVRTVASRGGNTFEVERGDGSFTLVLMPSKFRKLIWAQRGDIMVRCASAAVRCAC